MPVKTTHARDIAHKFKATGKPLCDGIAPSPVRATTTAENVATMNFEDGESAALAKLNKTERRYYELLKTSERRGEISKVRIHAFTLRLGFDTRYTPDFSAIVNGRETMFEVKGFMRDDAAVKLKVAAAEFAEFDFILVRFIKGRWEEKRC